MKIYDVSRLPSQIVIGHGGENDWLPIHFDCSALLENHPDGVITLWLTPNGAAEAYPVALEREGNVVTWTPKNSELTASTGRYQLRCQDGDAVGESDTKNYKVKESLAPGADHPAETPSWAVQVVADVTAQADRAEEAAESIGESIGEQLPGAIADYLEEHPVTVTETDPTVPAWAKNPQKPSYTAAEVGALPDSYTPPVTSVNGKTGAVTLSASDVHALPDDTVIPTKTSDLQNDSGFLTQHQSLAAYRTASAQDTIDAAQDAAIAAKYTKPSGGIPKSDLASDVQTSLGKADTALQSHQSLSGYATESWVQQQGYQTAQDVATAIAAAAELPTVTASDNGKFLRVVNGAWAAQTVPFKTPRVAMTASDTTPTLDPNKLYVFPEMSALTITLATPTDGTIVNEYHFIFESGATATTTTFPAIPGLDDFAAESNMAYEISILEGRALVTSWEVTA